MNKRLTPRVIGLIGLIATIFYGCDSDSDDDTMQPQNTAPVVANAIGEVNLEEGFGTSMVSLANVFSDAETTNLTLTATSANTSVVTVSISGTTLQLTEAGVGTSNITVTANDGDGGTVNDQFLVTVTESMPPPPSVDISFGTNTGNSIAINQWTDLNSADGYVIVMSDANSISNLTNGDDPASSTSYVGTGEQVIYNGTSVSALDITLLTDQETYYFKVFPYTGNFVYDNDQSVEESTTLSCATTSTTQSQVCFSIDEELRIISSNQFPSHSVGNFPNADPTAIEITRELDLTPAIASNVTFVFNETGPPTPSNRNFWQFGIAVNGVEFHPMGLKPWTNPSNGEENWEWQEQVTEQGQTNLDAFGAHVTSQGNYHYHGDIVALASQEDGSRHSLIYGFAGDGFPIYYKYGYTDPNDPTSPIKELLSSHRLKSGMRLGDGMSAPDGAFDGTYIQDFEFVMGQGDLDECNGRTGVTPEYPNGTYYYVLTSDFPIVPNCFAGTPDEDWLIGK
ncbi:MAG: YHYH protein [Bacteroidota bacterium]